MTSPEALDRGVPDLDELPMSGDLLDGEDAQRPAVQDIRGAVSG